MSDSIWNATQGLRSFMFQNVYNNPKAKGEEKKVKVMVKSLYEYYISHVEEMPEEFVHMIKQSGEIPHRVVCDYISGMSDPYSVAVYEELFVPSFWNCR